MPRTKTASAEHASTATTALNGSAGLGDVGPDGLERIPDFESPSRRPETCDVPSAWGVKCTTEAFHSGAHSWGGEQAPVETSQTDLESTQNSTRQTDSVEQPSLPGTPEPESEQTDFDVPFESQFNNRDLLPAPGLRTIGERLIESATDQDGFDHLQGISIDWFWKRRGGTKGGNPNYGGVKRPSAFEKHYSGGKVIYCVWLAADHVREAKFTPEQIEACLYDQLTRTDVDPEDHDAYRIIGPDFVGSIRTLQRFGVWSQDLKEAAAHIQQLPLVQLEADDADADGDQSEAEADEGEPEQGEGDDE